MKRLKEALIEARFGLREEGKFPLSILMNQFRKNTFIFNDILINNRNRIDSI